jgi:hypothetical protein
MGGRKGGERGYLTHFSFMGLGGSALAFTVDLNVGLPQNQTLYVSPHKLRLHHVLHLRSSPIIYRFHHL